MIGKTAVTVARIKAVATNVANSHIFLHHAHKVTHIHTHTHTQFHSWYPDEALKIINFIKNLLIVYVC